VLCTLNNFFSVITLGLTFNGQMSVAVLSEIASNIAAIGII